MFLSSTFSFPQLIYFKINRDTFWAVVEKIKKDDTLKRVGKSIYTQPWFVYIVQCQDKTLYVGIAKDVLRRIRAHNTTNRCRYTRFRKPIVLLYKEVCENYNIARKREFEIKRFSRKKKLEIVNSFIKNISMRDKISRLPLADSISDSFTS